MAERLAGKTALIIGAGSVGTTAATDGDLGGWGNGKTAATLFAREGARVFAVDLRADAVADTRKIIEREGGSCETMTADATNESDIEKVVAACIDQFGQIDILMNNVGGSIPGGPVEMSVSEWQGNLDLNLKTAFLGCKYALPHMVNQGKGSILNVSSVAGTSYLGRDMVSYATAKAGLIQFSKSVARQYAAAGIRANTIVPGLMNTPLVMDRIADQYGAGDIDETIAMRDAMCPTGKMGTAWDVGWAAVFLASDEARYVTGTEIVVDGGLTA
ncbi:MAG: SDR family oxidoreductase [Alphaproteobacteria bacterium]|jgi:NAD(P)-dependent dehydrogenase (short-subunit alcohol dehydrogenase family)|nr:SDR family oxidoreductase [Alphaproteobacteria bacterium]MBT4018678.1 SDR family oxidoreductase [Alphaproteobacteria bacterium]MBT5161091.1 SDR family oxidoreductase [Alphaproteobacteria bacterium]MBT5920111.1 SDR family oxidoreductase [Alphaproteobacteria bacterium]MBT6386146.1 SDR family oxidoreductase [Alphaproteobacteria bacterium]